MNLTASKLGCAIALLFALSAGTGKASPPVPATAPASATTTPVRQPLKTEVYNPGTSAIFPVTSTLVTGAHDAVLVDAQFSTVDAQKLVALIKASGKRLTTIYVSHGDPDFYFGLVTLTSAFPEAKVLATPQTVAHITATSAGKLQFWGPKLGAGAPERIVLPQPLAGSRIDLEGSTLEIVGLDGPAPDRTFVWIPTTRTVLGGITVTAGEHVWMADTQTPASHAHWLATLDRIVALEPDTVIPGHFGSGAARDLDAVRFTADYIRAFDDAAAKAANAGELVAAMKQRYPGLGGVSSLELGAKVSKGEMAWP